jgi:hypothetical protein
MHAHACVHARTHAQRRRYDVAISTACPALNYIVVETTSDAQRCVELLRRRSLGVGTCLIMEKQRHLERQMAEAVATPEGALCCVVCACVRVRVCACVLFPGWAFQCATRAWRGQARATMVCVCVCVCVCACVCAPLACHTVTWNRCAAPV